MLNLEGKVAIVTGASRGLGRSEARIMAQQGAKVVITGRRLDVLKETAAEFEADGLDILALTADATSREDWDRVVKAAIEKYGKLDILVNNAGNLTKRKQSTWMIGPEFDAEAWKDLFDQILFSQLYGIQACVEELKKTKGCIVNTGSVSAMADTKTVNAYTTAKAALMGITEALAMLYAKDGIRVNTIVPGWMRSDLNAYYTDSPEHPMYQMLMPNMLLGDFGHADDIGNMVCYLVSDEAKYITGQNVVVCGGWTLR